MRDGADRCRWDHTSLLATILANANRDPKKSKAFSVEDFHPYEETNEPGIVPENIDSLKVFLN